MTPLGRYLRRTIAREGPITLARFMAEALGHPRHGYYATRDPLGAAGDFTTAPEISQMFGELIGLWCVECWRSMGRPAPFRLVELGPGRGTLMADALRAAGLAPDFLAAAELHLVETSPALRERQRHTLAARTVRWHAGFADVPPGPMLLVANEFFDALPIHQFERTAEGWRERLVAAGPEGFRLTLATAPTAAAALLPAALEDAVPGAVAEVSPAALTLAAAIAGRLAADGGAALIVDYGPAASAAGDTFQAVRRHAPTDPFAAPGEADLTAHVDFAALARAAAAAGAAVHGPLGQGVLLERLGIRARAEVLMAAASARQRIDIAAGLDRLIGRHAMGTLFKALALGHPALPPPPGFEPGG